MAVDIGSGSFHKELQDISIQGHVPLIWQRNYSTAILSEPPAPPGRGWTNQYFCRLLYRDGTYSFTGPAGSIEQFPDPARRLEQGAGLINFAAFLDLQLAGNRLIVRHWDVGTGEVVHYVFHRTRTAGAWPLQAIENPAGQGLDLEYDRDGRLQAVIQRLEHRRLIIAYDGNGWIREVAFRPNGGEASPLVRYRHDAAGSLLTVTDAAGLEDHYEYDAQGRLTREIIRDGGVFAMRYDDRGRCVHVSGLDRYDQKRLKFLDAARFVEVTDSTGAVTRYRCRADGQIEEEFGPLGDVTRTTYDAEGRVESIMNPEGGTTTFTYDAAGNRDGATLPLGQQVRLEFNAAHLPLTLIDASGARWERQYDAANRLIASRDPAGGSWSYSYDRAGNLTGILTATGARKTLTYDTAGVLASGTDWMGHVNRYAFDSFGRLIEKTDPLGHVTRLRYDVAGNLAEHQAPDGTVRRAEYDGAGNLIRYIDADGTVTRYVYGTCGRLLQVVRPDGSSTRFRWTTEPERLSEILNERGESLKFGYDPAGNLIEETGFDGKLTRYRYNGSGWCTAIVNGSEEETRIDRDVLGRMTGRHYPDGTTASFTYDPLGRMATASERESTLSFAYDPAGRLVKETQGDQWVQNTYDPDGQLVKTETSAGRTVSFQVDGNGSLTRVTAGGRTLAMAYDARGLETRRQLTADVALYQSFNPAARLVEQVVRRGGMDELPVRPAGGASAASLQRSYTYDLNGFLKGVEDNLWGRKTYEYDRRDRLIGVRAEGSLREDFAYEPRGNLVEKKRGPGAQEGERLTYGAGNRLEQRGSTLYRYDGEGRLIAREEGLPSGRQRKWEYRWDAGNNLIGVVTPEGETWSYAYDALGRRTSKSKDGVVQTRFVWNEQVLAEEIRGNAATGWVFARDNFAPLMRLGPVGQASPVVCDQLGTPIAFVRDDGTLERAQQLTAWGETAEPAAGQEVGSPFRFQGQYFDAETGFHYSRFRYYDPGTGRFISQDPIGVHGGINLYEYATNPVNFVDALGLSTSSDSRELGNNLRGVSENPKRPGVEDAHHIVMSNSTDPRMVKLQNVLASRGIDINNPANGVWLPNSPGDRKGADQRTAHKGEGVHSNAYKQHVYDTIMAGSPPPPSKQEILNRLAKLKKQLKQGKTFPCKK